MHKLWTGVIAVSLLFPFVANATIEISDGSVKALYHFSGDSVDSSGNGYNGSDTNMSYSTGAGKFGQGAGFNGTSKITLTTLPHTGTPFTGSYNFWFNTSSTARMGLIDHGDTTTNNDEYQPYITAAHKFQTSFAAVGGVGTSGTVNDGNYHMGTLTCTTGTCIAYYDGSSLGSFGGGNIQITNTGTPIRVFGDVYGGAYPYSGYIDEIMITNNALSTSTISQLYNSGTGNDVCTTTGCADTPTSTPSSTTGLACTSNICIKNLEHLYLILVVGIFTLALFLGKKLVI